VLHKVQRHGLLSLLDGIATSLSSAITDPFGQFGATSPCEIWHHQDQLILTWLLSTLSPSILAQAISCDSLAALWLLLHQTYSAKSQSQALELKLQLQTLKKAISYTECLTKLNAISL
jgi:gag-polypeptide of LTR copia-type